MAQSRTAPSYTLGPRHATIRCERQSSHQVPCPAAANRELGLLPDDIADAISRACREIRDGNLHNQFVVDVIQ